jgi:hypothetical protein
VTTESRRSTQHDGAVDVTAAADRLFQAVDRLAGQVSHWQPSRWSAAATAVQPGAGRRSGRPSDRVFELVQRLADLVAAVEQRPRLEVPRLADLVLPDQLRVVAADLVTAGAPVDVVTAAADDVAAVRRTL